jgi:hypothetical protein
MLLGVQRVWGNEPSHSQGNSHCGSWSPKWTPELLKYDYRGQNPLAWRGYYIIGKLLKHRCLKWARIVFWHLKHKLWRKERSRVKLTIWLPTTKSQESTWFPRMQVAYDIPLESSWRGLQLCFKPHCNWRSTCKVMGPQSRGSPSGGIPTLESRDKKPFGCGPRAEVQSIL